MFKSPPILTKDNKRYYKNIIYPTIPLSENDIYVITSFEDRYDLLADEYYGNVKYWWIISIANEKLNQNSLFPPVGSQIRIPLNLDQILEEFYKLNG